MTTAKEPKNTSNGQVGKIPKRKLLKSDLQRMRIPRRFWPRMKKPLDDFEDKKILIKYYNEICDKVRKGESLILSGPNDIGKTTFACEIIKEARRYGYYGFFIRAYDYIDACFLKEMYNREMTIPERTKEVDVLILDDLGKELGGSDRAIGMLASLIKYRVEECKTTIITTNISTPKEFIVDYGVSFQRSMRGVYHWINFEGPSYRDKMARELKKEYEDDALEAGKEVQRAEK